VSGSLTSRQLTTQNASIALNGAMYSPILICNDTSKIGDGALQSVIGIRELAFVVYDGNITPTGHTFFHINTESGIESGSIGIGSYVSSAERMDTYLFISGAIGGKNNDVKRTVTLFGGDVVMSGSLSVNAGISGSLTKLADGTSYLIAGTNTAIVTGVNGAVTISSTTYFNSLSNANIYTTGSAAFVGAEGITNTATKGTDVFFYVSGSNATKNSLVQGVSLFGGDIVSSGSIYPALDLTTDLGSTTNRFRNIYTGDLHLRNERGNWTIVEEADYLCVVNNLTGKKYKMNLTPLEE